MVHRISMKAAFVFLAIALFNWPQEAHGFQQLGCFRDKGDKDLSHLARKGKVTVPICYELCKHKYAYFGVHNSNECYCGKTYGRYGAVSIAECNVKCSGDKETYCGGHLRTRVYSTGLYTISRGFHQLGCFKDTDNRDLNVFAFRGGLTLSKCHKMCRERNYAYFAVQVSDSCFCGSRYGRYGAVPLSECNMKCNRDKSTRCGGHWRNRVFTTGLSTTPHELQHIGCFKDKANRDLPFLARRGKVTVEVCNELCKKQHYAYFGMQLSNECWCGNAYGQFGEAHDGDCNMMCTGDAETLCGGHWRNRIFSTGLMIKLPGVKHLGCFKDKNKRDLPIVHKSNRASKSYCWNFCSKRGYRYFGLQGTSWCTCGNSFGRYGRASSSECNEKCSGDSGTFCGGNFRNKIFTTGRKSTRAQGLKRLGCFKDKAHGDLARLALTSKKLSVKQCHEACKKLGYAYFGLQAGKYCFCGSKYGRYGLASDGDCNIACSGEPAVLCGGRRRNEIFATGLTTSYGNGRALGYKPVAHSCSSMNASKNKEAKYIHLYSEQDCRLKCLHDKACEYYAFRDNKCWFSSRPQNMQFQKKQANGVLHRCKESCIGTQVFCKFQQHIDNSVKFDRTWREYENGFGNSRNFWIGLKWLHEITTMTKQHLIFRAEMTDLHNRKIVSENSGFVVGSASTKYTLKYESYLRDASTLSLDGLAPSNNKKFSTKDRNNENLCGESGRNDFHGSAGWWFSAGMPVNPNGIVSSRQAKTIKGYVLHWMDAKHRQFAIKRIRLLIEKPQV